MLYFPQRCYMKVALSAGLILLCLFPVYAERVAVLPEIYNAGSIMVDADHIYIVQEATIFIYSIEDHQFLKKFGKRGEGPGEFILSDDNMVDLSVQPEYLLVNSVKRISYFSTDGKYLRERSNSAGLWMVPIGPNFLGMKRVYDPDGTRYRKLTLFDEKLEPEKTVYQEFDGIQPRLKIIEAVTWPTSAIYRVYRDKIFVADKEKTMYVYNQAGDKLYAIQLPFARIKVDGAVKEKYLKIYREEDPYWRIRWDRLKSWFRFPDQLPVVQYFTVKDDQIYILSHHGEQGKSEFLILDLKGNLKRRVMVPIKKGEWDAFNVYPYDIQNEMIYQLAENPDTEEHELHVFELR
jgi:hypothetical protein